VPLDVVLDLVQFAHVETKVLLELQRIKLELGFVFSGTNMDLWGFLDFVAIEKESIAPYSQYGWHESLERISVPSSARATYRV
jgi:hypothetical protein